MNKYPLGITIYKMSCKFSLTMPLLVIENQKSSTKLISLWFSFLCAIFLSLSNMSYSKNYACAVYDLNNKYY